MMTLLMNKPAPWDGFIRGKLARMQIYCSPCLILSSCACTEYNFLGRFRKCLRQQTWFAKRNILANFRSFRHLPINPHTITPILCHSSTTPSS